MIIDDHKVIIDGENVIYVRYGFWPARGRVKKKFSYLGQHPSRWLPPRSKIVEKTIYRKLIRMEKNT